MKHKAVLIQLSDLITRLDTDSDNFHLSDAMGIEGADEAVEAKHLDEWIEVTWPEHVLTPRYNADATYRATGAKRLQDLDLDCYGAALIYGEAAGVTLGDVLAAGPRDLSIFVPASAVEIRPAPKSEPEEGKP